MWSLYKQFGIEIMDWTYRLRTISEKLYYLKLNDDFKVDTSWCVKTFEKYGFSSG